MDSAALPNALSGMIVFREELFWTLRQSLDQQRFSGGQQREHEKECQVQKGDKKQGHKFGGEARAS
jgi:hypothetical protein